MVQGKVFLLTIVTTFICSLALVIQLLTRYWELLVGSAPRFGCLLYGRHLKKTDLINMFKPLDSSLELVTLTHRLV